MKKRLLILFIIPFIVSGCFDYQELNDRALIVGAAIDYQDDNYIVNFEVLNSMKSGSEQSGPNKSYLVEGKDSTFSSAYQKALFSLDKDAYLAHLKAVVFSEEVAKNHLEDIVDYLIRDPSTRNVFYPVVSKNYQAKDILANTSEETLIVSSAIEGIIDYNNFKESITTNINFESFLELLLNKREDAYINVITIDEDNNLKADGLAIFNDYKMVGFLDKKQSATAILLNNKSQNYYLKLPCEDNKEHYITLNFYDSKNTDLIVNENNVVIKSSLNANISDDECSYDFKDPKIYQQISQKFKPEVEKTLKNALELYMHLNSDILGIKRKYYIKNRTDLNNWNNLTVSANADILVNKNGIVFEVRKND